MTRTADCIVANDGYYPRPEPLMTAAEVCEWLGIGDTSLRELEKALLLVRVPLCRHRRYDPADVRRLIETLKGTKRSPSLASEVAL